MTWFDNFSAQFWGELCAGALLLPLALWAEAWLDERRDQRHKDDPKPGWLDATVDTLIANRDAQHKKHE